MSGLWSRRDVRTAVYAAIFAAWCVGWVFGALEITRPLPGVLSLKGTSGAYEIVQWFTGQPTWMVAVAFAVASFLLAWLLLKLAHRLDREGEARAALRWALSSKSLNLLIFLLPTASIIVALILMPYIEAWILLPVFAVVIGPLVVLTPFVVLNPKTLRTARLLYWRHPQWPGWWPVVATLLLASVFSPAAGFAADALADGKSLPVRIIIELLDFFIDSVVEIAVIVIWLLRGRRDAIRIDLVRVVDVRFVGAYLAYVLMTGLFVSMLAVPVLVQSAYSTYIAPQYADLAQHSEILLPWSMQLFSNPMQSVAEWVWLPLSLPISALSLLWLARLLVRHGVGESLSDVSER